jgi:hypothetical protein
MTYLGGDGSETAHALAVDARDRLWIAGATSSAELLTLAAAATVGDDTYGGGAPFGGDAAGDGFVLRVSAVGDAVEFGSFIGGSGSDEALGVAVADDGAVWTVGSRFNHLCVTFASVRFCQLITHSFKQKKIKTVFFRNLTLPGRAYEVRRLRRRRCMRALAVRRISGRRMRS